MDTLNAESTALVVGASGGIGHAFVRRLLAESRVRRVWAATRSPRSPDLMALGEAYGDRLAPVVVDILDEQSIADLARHIGGRDPRLHLLINAFGFLHDREADIWPEKRLEDITPEAMLRNYRVNTLAPALIARHFLPLLNHRERAVFASLSARVGSIGDNRLGGWYSYRTSKAAQNMFTRGLAIECGRRAKRVICLALHPGTTDTGLSEPFQGRVPEDKLFSPDFAAGKLLERIDAASAEDSGGFFAWDGAPIPW
ncbi:SDR family NAD(P)-dependent oxidoreductase [Spiribacter insolitus]|uniref:SDR family NAD(P)-dependent oxidoreductase n=1 Tax=Spiribacter insolitus TaxID=3122417 RepID=A0ABV3T663_9GAMM